VALRRVVYSCQSGCIDVLSLADSDSVSIECIHLPIGNQEEFETIGGDPTLMPVFDKGVE